MNVLIVEDEILSAERLKKMIADIDQSIHVLAIIPSVFETIAFLENESNIRPDLIFLDIHLEDDNGFRIVERLNLTIPIIFTTAFDAYAIKAFKTNSIDYLLKPINPLELQAALGKFKKLSIASLPAQAVPPVDATVGGSYKDRFLCTAGSRIFTFQSHEIAYFIIEEKATFLRLFDGRHFAIEYSLEKLSQIMDPEKFFRINRALMISIQAIQNIHTIATGKLKIELTPPLTQETYVSTDRVAAFKTWLGR